MICRSIVKSANNVHVSNDAIGLHGNVYIYVGFSKLMLAKSQVYLQLVSLKTARQSCHSRLLKIGSKSRIYNILDKLHLSIFTPFC